MSGAVRTLDIAPEASRQPRHIDSNLTDGIDAARASRMLSAIAWTRAALLSLGAGATAFIVTGLLVSSGVGLPRSARLLAGLSATLLSLALLRWRARPVNELRAALWLEEHVPSGYARVALAEDRANGGALLTAEQRAALQHAHGVVVRREQLSGAFRAVRRHQLMPPALFLTLSAALVALQLYVDRERSGVLSPEQSSANGARGSQTVPPIGRWRVRVTPPAYSGLASQSLGDASSLRALAGTVVDIEGDGAVPAMTARLLDDSANMAAKTHEHAPEITSRANVWSTRIAVPAGPLELRASRGGATRLLLIEGFADSIPRVTLRRPERDSVLRSPTGRLALQASAHDDIGLSSASFELIVSSGEGERFTARTVTVGAQRLGGSRDRDVSFMLDLAPLSLGPGDVIHMRAVARDGNPASRREAGSSETRSFRVARPSEYDSVAVEPAPPPAVDSSLLSQRMLLMLTEKLDKRRASLERAVLLGESGRIAKDQARLRQAVGNIVFQRLSGEQGAEHEHTVGDGHDHGVDLVNGKLAVSGKDAGGTLDEGDDSPIIAVNRPLLEAYNAMWDAGRAMEQADTRAAIPYMKLALAAIERARSASRYYLRGKPPTVIVDIAKVRLAGKDTGSTNARSPRAPLPPADALRERRLLAAASLLATDAAAARDSLAVLRLESVSESPAFADALGATLDALGAHRDVTPSLVRARHALGGVARLQGGMWSRPGAR